MLFLKSVRRSAVHATKNTLAEHGNDGGTAIGQRCHPISIGMLVAALLMQHRTVAKGAVQMTAQDKTESTAEGEKKQADKRQPAMQAGSRAPETDSIP